MMIANFVMNILGTHGAHVFAGSDSVPLADNSSRRPTRPLRSRLADQEPPFVLVAHDEEGKWDVYAKRFDTPLASFDEREPACDYASRLASARRDCLILLRDKRQRQAAIA
jgi:hypothetical protein